MTQNNQSDIILWKGNVCFVSGHYTAAVVLKTYAIVSRALSEETGPVIKETS